MSPLRPMLKRESEMQLYNLETVLGTLLSCSIVITNDYINDCIYLYFQYFSEALSILEACSQLSLQFISILLDVVEGFFFVSFFN